MELSLVNGNNKGQALIESVISLPFIILFTGGLMWVLYLLLVNLWFSYWVYQTNVCLVRENTRWYCQDQLTEKLTQVTNQHYFKVKELWITNKQSTVSVDVKFDAQFGLGYANNFVSEISLPLRLA